MQATTVMAGYPVEVRFSEDSPGSRLSVFFRFLMAIPVLIVQSILSYAYGLTSFLAWFAILFTGRYPRGLYTFGENYLRMSADVSGYVLLLTDKYPPFYGSGQAADGYPVQLRIAYPEHSSRLLIFFRWLLAIPHFILLGVAVTVGFVLAFVAWVVVLITGQLPGGFRRFFEWLIRYTYRVNGYVYMMTDAYPPFSFDFS